MILFDPLVNRRFFSEAEVYASTLLAPIIESIFTVNVLAPFHQDKRTMKFLKQALAIALMSFTSVEAKKTFTRQDFADAVAAGRIDQQRLLKNAIPYNQALRRRAEGDDEDQDGDGQEDNQDQQYDDGYERVELTSNFRLQFNSCLTMETENYNLMLDNLVQYTKAGTLKSVRNYILFDVCDGDNCQAETWMVDLLTFIEAVVEYGPSRKDTVCQACATYGDEVCGTTYYYNNGYNDGNNNGGRKLQVDYQVFDESMCDECDAQKCWYDGEGDQQMDFASIEGWITEIAECKLNDQQWNGLNTYAGWMCNADGSGIQVGVFLDEYCRMYQSNLQYTSVMENDEYQYFFQSQDVIPYMFTDIIECTDQSYVQYVSEDELADIEAAGGYYSYQDGYGGISAACYSLFYSDFVPRQVGNCGDETDLTDEQLAQQQQMYENYYNNGQNMYQYVQAQQMVSSSILLYLPKI